MIFLSTSKKHKGNCLTLISISIYTSPYSYFISSQSWVLASEVPVMLVIINFSGTLIHPLSYFSCLLFFLFFSYKLVQFSIFTKTSFDSIAPLSHQPICLLLSQLSFSTVIFCINFSLIYQKVYDNMVSCLIKIHMAIIWLKMDRES